ncbi:Transcription factor COE1 [Tyrophagus putrescentiae]|nr:Transcription factor COE1 [Tyrophagus putrescentiae]
MEDGTRNGAQYHLHLVRPRKSTPSSSSSFPTKEQFLTVFTLILLVVDAATKAVVRYEGGDKNVDLQRVLLTHSALCSRCFVQKQLCGNEKDSPSAPRLVKSRIIGGISLTFFLRCNQNCFKQAAAVNSFLGVSPKAGKPLSLSSLSSLTIEALTCRRRKFQLAVIVDVAGSGSSEVAYYSTEFFVHNSSKMQDPLSRRTTTDLKRSQKKVLPVSSVSVATAKTSGPPKLQTLLVYGQSGSVFKHQSPRPQILPQQQPKPEEYLSLSFQSNVNQQQSTSSATNGHHRYQPPSNNNSSANSTSASSSSSATTTTNHSEAPTRGHRSRKQTLPQLDVSPPNPQNELRDSDDQEQAADEVPLPPPPPPPIVSTSSSSSVASAPLPPPPPQNELMLLPPVNAFTCVTFFCRHCRRLLSLPGGQEAVDAHRNAHQGRQTSDANTGISRLPRYLQKCFCGKWS